MVEFNRSDLQFVLTQILIAEAGQPPVNATLSYGLRTVDGTDNSVVPGQAGYGAADQSFPTVSDPLLQKAQSGTSYASTNGLVIDAQPRIISNLIADQTANNPAAVAAQAKALAALGQGYQNLTQAGADKVFGTADDYVDGWTQAGNDGILGTADDITILRAEAGADGLLGTTDDVFTTGLGADGKLGGGDDVTVGVKGQDRMAGTADDILIGTHAGNLATPTNSSTSGASIPGLAQSLFINNVPPDAGLSAPFSSWMTFFGQFFDHGLDMIDKGGSGTVYIPLTADDPLYVKGGHSNFMVLTRATNLPGPDKILGTADDIRAHKNVVTPFIDQSQTYSSHPSHQVFLREYIIGADGNLHSTGGLLSHHNADGTTTMATWGELKENAAKFLGIKLTDADVGDVPLLATDAYGNFLPGAHGLPQLVIRNADGSKDLREGNLANPVSTDNALRADVPFIADMAHSASPTNDFGAPLVADMDTVAGGTPATGFYDNELLDAHYVAGDGRVNENIGLTSIQNIFHSEHGRILAQTKALIQAELANGDMSFAADWVLPGVDLSIPTDGHTYHVIQANEWNGERLFQAAKFAEETEYQHMILGEFARMVDPAIHVFGNVNIHLDAAITSEFANVVYRFGHSMLDENINLYQIDPATGRPMIDAATGQPIMTEMGLIQAFTNPLAFANDPNATANIVLGSINQVGNEIDEFVTGSLRDNLLGLPLDLGALNIARGRDTGVAPLNLFRAQMFSETGDNQLRPYSSWDDFGQFLKHPESLINFVAAYGTHASITTTVDAVTGMVRATTMAERRDAAGYLVHHGTIGDPLFDPSNLDAYNFMHSLGAYSSNAQDSRAIHDAAGAPAAWSTGSVTGLDQVDMWIGGLAEKQNLFGSMLGSTFEFIFRTQMEALQDGDRLYYLPRTEGMHFNTELENSSFAQLIRDNTGIKHLPGNIFRVPEYTIESSDYFQKYAADVLDNAGNKIHAAGDFLLDADGHRIATDSSTWLHNPQTGELLVNVEADGSVHFLGDNNFFGNTIVLGGTEDDDRLVAGTADDDAVWGDGGNDFIDGGGGNDFLYGGDGGDTITGGQGDDFIHGDAGNDSIEGGDGIDNIFGSTGDDTISGGRADDAIMGGEGNDIIRGGEGVDELIGNEGDDWIEGGLGGDLLNGDIGAPTGQVPLYGGNDVLIGGQDGGDRMQGFSGDDIMLGIGSFDKFEGRLGFDWASYEQATRGVDADLTRREFIAANGAVDTIRDFFIAVEGVSGSAFDDILKGSDNTSLLATKDQLTNFNLIDGLPGFFDVGTVIFDGGNILLGGAGNDLLIGGGGNDIIDGDAMLHVGLTSDGHGGQTITREILFDQDGSTWIKDEGTGIQDQGTGHINPLNVDTAVYSDLMANYRIAEFGPDAEGFLTIQYDPLAGSPVAAGAINDGTDRIRNIERLQFADGTVAIDPTGRILSSTKTYAHYDVVPIGTPLITETAAVGGASVDPTTTVTVGNTLRANIHAVGSGLGVQPGELFDGDGVGPNFSYQWQVLDVVRAVWIPIAGATKETFVPTTFQEGNSIRVLVSYTDGKGYVETVSSAPTALATLRGDLNTAPFVVQQQQLTGIADTSGTQGQPIDFFSPFTSIFSDKQTAANQLTYKAVVATNGQTLDTVGLVFTFDSVTGQGHFTGTLPGNISGPLAIRVTATDPGGLSVTDTFVINVQPANLPPKAYDDAYTVVENGTLGIHAARIGVLANDSDPNGDPITARLVAGPAHGSVVLNTDGTFDYTATGDYVGTDSFTYQVVDSRGAIGNTATATVTVTPALTAGLALDTGASPNDGITSKATIVGSGFANAKVFASIDGQAAMQVATADATGAWQFTPQLADGSHSIVVTETDLAGNIGQKSLNFVLDTMAPPVSVALVADTGSRSDDAITMNARLSGKGDPSATVLVRIDGGMAVSVPTDASGKWVFTPSVSDGKHTVEVVGTDAAGNVGTGGLSFELDTTAPAAPVIAGITYTSSATALSAYAVSGIAEHDGAVTLRDGSGQVLGTTTAAADGSWSISVAPTTTANIVAILAATAVDAAGNASASQNDGLVVGSSGANTLTAVGNLPSLILGLGGNDSLEGGDGADTLDGGTGNDGMAGGAGNDTYVVDSALDVVTELASGGVDTVRTALGSYTLGANLENLAYTGAGSFAGTGNTLANVITGGAGNDTLAGGLNTGGGDTLIGGAGNDTYIVSNAGDVVTELGGGIDTVQTKLGSYTLGANLENLTFTGTGGFAGTGNGLANVIRGGAGADTLDGGTNATGGDTLIGGAGDDTYIVRNAGDVVTELSGGGNDTVLTTLSSYTLGGSVETLSFTGTGNFTGTGSSLAVRINGGAGDDTLNGGAGTGADTLAGGDGNDTYIVNSVLDVVIEAANGGIDAVRTALGSYTLGANLENLAYTGAGSFAGTGNTLANVITGGAGNDTLAGGLNTGGGDTLIGGAGNDTYIVSNAGDVVTELGGGIDTVQTKLGSYTLGANLENLTFTGTGGFAGTGNGLANVIRGGAGADTLDGGTNATGGDTLIGGAGDDTYIVRNAGDVVTELSGGGNDTVLTTLSSYTLGGSVETLSFTGTGNFTGTGSSLAVRINGGAGDDTLNGGAGTGADTLAGGDGNDTYIVNSVLDVVIEAANGGIDAVRTALGSYTLGANLENLAYTGAGSFAGTGNTLANVITGGAGNDTLAGGLNTGGGDTLIGGAGNDTYIVSNAGDVVTELGGGIDTVQTKLGSYTLGANLENLTFTGTGGFAGTGNGLANVIRGGAGADTLDGGTNATGGDTLIGGAGDDTYIVRNAGDVVTENFAAGTDTVKTTLSTYTLGANLENLTFIGTGGFVGTGNTLANVITGGAGADSLNGGVGNDQLTGGAGADTLTGGTGSDIFFLVHGDTNGDVITDFSRTGINGTDHVVFSGYGLGAVLVHGAGTSYTVQVGGVTQDTITVNGVAALTTADYIFA